jgi:hypothetical protein
MQLEYVRYFLFYFAGGGILTILLGPLFGYLLMQSPNLICPTSQLTVRDCDPYILPLFSGKRTLPQCCKSGSGAFLIPGSRIRDPGWGKNSDLGSGINIPNHFSESLETVFRVKNADPQHFST